MKWCQDYVFPTNPDLADILGDTDFGFDNFIFLFFWIPNFQISRFPDFRTPAAGGPSWPQAGPKLGAQKIQKIKILKIQIRSAQNVGKVWISRKKILLTPFGPIWAHFLRGPEKCKTIQNLANFPWWANGQPLLLITLGGQIGNNTSKKVFSFRS